MKNEELYKKSAAYRKGYDNSKKDFYWAWKKEQDSLRFKSEQTRNEFERGYNDGICEKYSL